MDKKVGDFKNSVLYLLLTVTGCAAFTALRGWFFYIVEARVKVRIRDMLLSAVLNQEIGFFDVTKGGDITSRLTADTTKVGDAISMNMNIMLRSSVQALGGMLASLFVGLSYH
jgi:ABC-type multidrug transport system fused ATPase/permease subunit